MTDPKRSWHLDETRRGALVGLLNAVGSRQTLYELSEAIESCAHGFHPVRKGAEQNLAKAIRMLADNGNGGQWRRARGTVRVALAPRHRESGR